MKSRIDSAKKAVKDVVKEFAPVGRHTARAGKEVLLAMRSVIDAEINLLEKCGCKEEPEVKIEVEQPAGTQEAGEEDEPVNPT